MRKLARRFQFRALPGIILGAPGSPRDRLGRSRDLENVVFAQVKTTISVFCQIRRTFAKTSEKSWRAHRFCAQIRSFGPLGGSLWAACAPPSAPVWGQAAGLCATSSLGVRRIGRKGGFVRKLAHVFRFRALPGIILGAPGSPGDRFGRSRDLENVVFA